MRLATTLACVLLSGTVACTSFSSDSTPPDAGVPAAAEGGADAQQPAAPDAGEPSTLDAGLLARWRFDDGAGVIAKNDVTTAPSGAITNATWGMGKLGGALVFDGVSSLVKVAGSPTLDVTTAFTLAVWVNVAHLDTNTGQRFLSQGPLDFKLNVARPQLSISAANPSPSLGAVSRPSVNACTYTRSTPAAVAAEISACRCRM